MTVERVKYGGDQVDEKQLEYGLFVGFKTPYESITRVKFYKIVKKFGVSIKLMGFRGINLDDCNQCVR